MGIAVLRAARPGISTTPASPILTPPVVIRSAAAANAVFAAFILTRPLPHTLFFGTADICLTLGLVGAAVLCQLPGRSDWGSGVPLRYAVVPYLLGLGVLSGAVTAG